MINNGALLEEIEMALAAVDPAPALILGVILGVTATLGIQRWSLSISSEAKRTKADPLSNLFAVDTLNDQIARIADPNVARMQKNRVASATHAKTFTCTSARPPKDQPDPDRADRFDHAAVLDHIAKVMRAGTSEDVLATKKSEHSSQWEEVLLLAAPKDAEGETAKAA